jgi:hypothetical protein
MSFPNPDNYARDCDCGTAGANATPPPVAIQAELDSLDTRVTALEETNDVIVSSGGIANLTTAQQALIREGSIVVTTDGKRWVYSGAGSKVLEASYIQLSDLTIGSTANLPLITGVDGVITAGSFGTTANSFCQGDDARLAGIGSRVFGIWRNVEIAGKPLYQNIIGCQDIAGNPFVSPANALLGVNFFAVVVKAVSGSGIPQIRLFRPDVVIDFLTATILSNQQSTPVIMNRTGAYVGGMITSDPVFTAPGKYTIQPSTTPQLCVFSGNVSAGTLVVDVFFSGIRLPI